MKSKRGRSGRDGASGAPKGKKRASVAKRYDDEAEVSAAAAPMTQEGQEFEKLLSAVTARLDDFDATIARAEEALPKGPTSDQLLDSASFVTGEAVLASCSSLAALAYCSRKSLGRRIEGHPSVDTLVDCRAIADRFRALRPAVHPLTSTATAQGAATVAPDVAGLGLSSTKAAAVNSARRKLSAEASGSDDEGMEEGDDARLKNRTAAKKGADVTKVGQGKTAKGVQGRGESDEATDDEGEDSAGEEEGWEDEETDAGSEVDSLEDGAGGKGKGKGKGVLAGLKSMKELEGLLAELEAAKGALGGGEKGKKAKGVKGLQGMEEGDAAGGGKAKGKAGKAIGGDAADGAAFGDGGDVKVRGRSGGAAQAIVGDDGDAGDEDAASDGTDPALAELEQLADALLVPAGVDWEFDDEEALKMLG